MRLTPHLPRRLAAKFTLLLLTSLLLANLIAALLLAQEGSEYDRNIRLEGDMGRLVALVGAIEEADPITADILVEQTSTGFTRFSLTPEPLNWMDAVEANALSAVVSRALPDHDVRVFHAQKTDDIPARRILMTLSVRINYGAHRGEWLNAIVYPLPKLTAWGWKRGFFVPLAVSFITVLTVGLWFVHRLTRPLKDLAAAANAVGRGDRSVHLPETGAQEFRDAATAFNEMQRQIDNFDQERARIISALGHDLRTPITGLRIYAEMVEDPVLYADIVRILDNMTVMADDLLHFSSGVHDAEPMTRIDLDAQLMAVCGARNIPYESVGPVYLTLRPVAITRAVGNLIDNALRYAGTAMVSLEVTPEAVCIHIDDNGPGLPQGSAEMLRQPFKRGEHSRNDQTGGVGLGLSIADSIMRSHSGLLILENRDNGGLRASLIFPKRGTANIQGFGAASAAHGR